MKILAGIVLYNPEILRLKENLDAISCQVDRVLIVSNNNEITEDLRELIETYKDIAIIDNKSNLGIATALKQTMDYAINQNYDWVLTLDQDSVCNLDIINEYKKYVSLEKVGILTCNIVDRNFISESGFKEGEKYKEIKQCITSASLISVDAYKLTDGFDEKLFIDSVDFDICINMRQHGFKIVRINFDGILHEVGHGKNVKLFLKKYTIYNHSVLRNYYIARNHMYLVKKYPQEFSYIKEKIREIIAEILILLYEKEKIKKIKSRRKGLRDVKKLI